MVQIFISYRRSDTEFAADQLYQMFCEKIPENNIFMDVDSIPVGTKFRDVLRSAIQRADYMLVLIGHNWLEAKDAKTGRRRLDDKNDYVRMEIRQALSQNIPVIPVLIGGASLPEKRDLPTDIRSFLEFQATIISRKSRQADIESLRARLMKPDSNIGGRTPAAEPVYGRAQDDLNEHLEARREGEERTAKDLEAQRIVEEQERTASGAEAQQGTGEQEGVPPELWAQRVLEGHELTPRAGTRQLADELERIAIELEIERNTQDLAAKRNYRSLFIVTEQGIGVEIILYFVEDDQLFEMVEFRSTSGIKLDVSGLPFEVGDELVGFGQRLDSLEKFDESRVENKIIEVTSDDESEVAMRIERKRRTIDFPIVFRS